MALREDVARALPRIEQSSAEKSTALKAHDLSRTPPIPPWPVSGNILPGIPEIP